MAENRINTKGAIQSIHVAPEFYPQSEELRGHFDQQFENPREAHEGRFVWDYWHIDDQYTLVRTPAYHFFPEELYEQFENHLIEWGKTHLGCASISPPWLSYYVEGCKQEMHADNPHGPWAFVYSLTDWENRFFEGGETFILKPELLNYWSLNFNEHGFEYRDLVTEIESHFNQLLVFDPRFPHGVREVRGERAPQRGRLAIHGWFTDPTPYVEGDVDDESISNFLNSCLEQIFTPNSAFSELRGHCCFRLDINTEGSLKELKVLTYTHELAAEIDNLSQNITKLVEQNLKTQNTLSELSVTLPIYFHSM